MNVRLVYDASSALVKLGTHYTRVHGPCPRVMDTDVILATHVHGPDTTRKHGPWTRVVCTEL